MLKQLPARHASSLRCVRRTRSPAPVAQRRIDEHNIVEGGCYQWPNYTPKPQQATSRWKMWALFLGLFAAGLIGVGLFVLL